MSDNQDTPTPIQDTPIPDATPDVAPIPDALSAAEERLRALEAAERAIDSSFDTGKAERAEITRGAHNDAEEAVRLVDIAMEADEMADDAARMSVIAARTRDRERMKTARQRERAARKQAKEDHKAASKAAKQAYDAIRFSAPNKLGFMRFLQVYFIFHIFYTLLMLTQTSRDTITYDSGTLFDWVMIMLQGVAFWFFVNQYKIAKPFVIGVGIVGIAYHFGYGIVSGNLSPIGFLIDTLFYIVLVLYFLFSKRVDYVMVNDFKLSNGVMERDDFEIDRHGWPFYRNLIIYFIIFSVFGHWMEAGMCQFIRLGWVQGEYDPTNTMLWRDWLYPYPMEGAAVVIIALVLYPLFIKLKEKLKPVWLAYVVSFLANALTCSLIEFTMGLIVNSNYQLWDYRENFGNIMGQVCLQNALAFGVAASIIAWFVYPLMERWIARVPSNIMNVAFVVIAVFGGILWSLYIIDPPKELTEQQLIEQQKSQEEKARDDETDGLEFSLTTTAITVESLKKQVVDLKYYSDAEKEQILDKLDESSKPLFEVINTLPDGEEAVKMIEQDYAYRRPAKELPETAATPVLAEAA